MGLGLSLRIVAKVSGGTHAPTTIEAMGPTKDNELVTIPVTLGEPIPDGANASLGYFGRDRIERFVLPLDAHALELAGER